MLVTLAILLGTYIPREGHRQKILSIGKQYLEQHKRIPKELLKRIYVLKTSKNKLEDNKS